MFRVLVASATEVLGVERFVCTDCNHSHGGAPHGFCKCGCTFPYEVATIVPIGG